VLASVVSSDEGLEGSSATEAPGRRGCLVPDSDFVGALVVVALSASVLLPFPLASWV